MQMLNLNLKKAVQAVQGLKDYMTKTPYEKLLMEATSDDINPVPTNMLYQISEGTYFFKGMDICRNYLWDIIKNNSISWRVLSKALTVLDYLLLNGHDDIVFEFREDIFYLNLLKEYQFTEFGEDKGKIVREKVLKVISMLENEKMLESQREELSKLKSRSVGITSKGEVVQQNTTQVKEHITKPPEQKKHEDPQSEKKQPAFNDFGNFSQPSKVQASNQPNQPNWNDFSGFNNWNNTSSNVPMNQNVQNPFGFASEKKDIGQNKKESPNLLDLDLSEEFVVGATNANISGNQKSQSAGIPTNNDINNNNKINVNKNAFDLMWGEAPAVQGQSQNLNKGNTAKGNADQNWGENPFDLENKNVSKNNNVADIWGAAPASAPAPSTQANNPSFNNVFSNQNANVDNANPNNNWDWGFQQSPNSFNPSAPQVQNNLASASKIEQPLNNNNAYKQFSSTETNLVNLNNLANDDHAWNWKRQQEALKNQNLLQSTQQDLEDFFK